MVCPEPCRNPRSRTQALASISTDTSFGGGMLKRRAMAFDGGEQPRRFVLCDQEAIIRVFAAPETPYEDRKQSAVTFDQRGNNPRETETSGHHEIDHFDAQQQQ